MPLPKIDLPVYQCELPSTGKKVKFRPFSVKEEKILLMAQESKDTEQMMLSIKQIVNNCLINNTIEDLPIFDVEYLLIQLRSKSVDNIVVFQIEDPETQETIKLEIDLSNVKIQRDENHTNKITISDEYSLFLKYPTIDQFEGLVGKEKQTSDDSYGVMIACIDKLASAEEVFTFKDFTRLEVDNFIDSLHSDTIKKIKQFFDTMPKVRHEVPYKNSKGEDKKFVVEGTQTFFI